MKSGFLFTTLLLLSSLQAISQTEPNVTIPRSVAISTVKELEQYDGLKLQHDLLEKKVLEMVKVIQEKDKQINQHKQSEGRLNLIISNQTAIEAAAAVRYKALEKKYKREVRMGRFKVVLLGGLTAFAIYQTIK